MNRLFACLLCLAFVVGCSDDTTGPVATPLVISGAVTDADGNPVADAAIVLDLALAPVVKAAAMPPATTIRIALPDSGTVYLTMLSSCRTDTFDHRELDLAEGVHMIPFLGTDRDGRQLTDQAVWIVVTTPEATSEYPIMLARNTEGEDGDYGDWDHPYVRDHVRFQATTDAEGWFTIADPCVGFGTGFTATNEMGEVIGEFEVAWRVRAWAYHADQAAGSASAWRDVDPDDGCTVSVILDD